ncbi:hypothetical protein [Stieleria varia]|uniref:Uncharacterized protein n=1 Tax=Stieleria varia TaxID=2528005 RepID=A0A5C6B1C8_9BACT|nr:hypothetical protein [Stieleria varia]TWU05680.1 hypothetical protein Pla52n_13950 [Stieleria varia]
MNASTKSSVVTPDSVQLQDFTRRLTLQFDWSDDRFVHRLVDAAAAVLQSVPGDCQQAWPSSPPLQQLSLESIGQCDVVLGVGCAGTSHWSVSVEPIEGGFRFDWACKSKETPQSLGTRYRLSDDFEFSVGQDGRVEQDAGFVSVHPVEPLLGSKTYRWSYSVRAKLTRTQ